LPEWASPFSSQCAPVLRRPAAHDAHDTITDLVTLHGRSGLDHLAGDFETHDRRVAEVRPAVSATPMGQIGAIHTRGMDAYQ
jgi:hypothetical protein